MSFSADGRLLASKGNDDTVILWRRDSWQIVATLDEPSYRKVRLWHNGLAFHPGTPVLATLDEEDTVVRIWDLDLDTLLSEPARVTVHYTNAKVVLVGDSGVGKSGLALVLSGQPFVPTESTHGRHVWMFDSQETRPTSVPESDPEVLPRGPTSRVPASPLRDDDREALRNDEAGHTPDSETENGKPSICSASAPSEWNLETRETFLWDLAGQPGYRLIHQLHLNEVAVALVVFDSRSETEPFAGVRHWSRVLRQCRARGGTAIPLKMYLVAARADRGGAGVSPERIDSVLRDFQFDGFFETGAREGWGIEELANAIRQAIAWETMPKVSSTELFQRIKAYLIEQKTPGRLLSTVDDLLSAFEASVGTRVDAEGRRAIRDLHPVDRGGGPDPPPELRGPRPTPAGIARYLRLGVGQRRQG